PCSDGVVGAVELWPGYCRARRCGGCQGGEAEHAGEDARLLVRDHHVEHAWIVEDPVVAPTIAERDRVATHRVRARGAVARARTGARRDAEIQGRAKVLHGDPVRVAAARTVRPRAG